MESPDAGVDYNISEILGVLALNLYFALVERQDSISLGLDEYLVCFWSVPD